jgi:hypothetical protein
MLDTHVNFPALLRMHPIVAEAYEVRSVRQGVPRYCAGNGEWQEVKRLI